MFKLRWLGLKNLKFACMFFRVRKNMHTRRVRCYFVNAKIAHACTQFMYVVVVFMNAHNLYLTLNIFISSLCTFFLQNAT